MAIHNMLYTSANADTPVTLHGDGKTTIEFINNGGKVELVHFVGSPNENAIELTEQKEQVTPAMQSALRITATGSAKVSVMKIEG